MTSGFTKTIRNSQPAILMVSALVYVGLDRRWAAALAVFFLLQVGMVLGGLLTKRHPERHRENVRFLARGVVAPLETPSTAPASKPRRPHLRLVS